MSTRSQIEFRRTRSYKDENGDKVERTSRLLTYKHSDGYPESVIPLLRDYWDWSGRTNQLDYFTAGWFYYVKRRHEELFSDEEHWHSYTGTQIGHGIDADGRLHGDIDHTYIVDMNEGHIHHYRGGRHYETVDDLEGARDPDKVYEINREDASHKFEV